MAGTLPPPPPPPGPSGSPSPGPWPPPSQPTWSTPTAPPTSGWGPPPPSPYPGHADYGRPDQGYGYAYGPPPGWTYIAPTWATRLGRTPAGFWERAGALILDTIILAVVSVPLVIAGIAFVAADWHTYEDTCLDERGFAYDCTQLTDATAARLILTILVGGLVMLVVSLWYWGHFEGRRGATPGKRAVGIEVVRQETGEPIGFGRAIGRTFARMISGQVLYLGYLWMLWDDNKQTWHDKIVSSIVVKAER